MWDVGPSEPTIFYTEGHHVYSALAGRYEALDCCTGIIRLICTTTRDLSRSAIIVNLNSLAWVRSWAAW